jgi:predicted nucleic acid-binding protein
VTVTVDINVLLDVFGKREPHYALSARVVDMITTGVLDGVCPAHGLTTIYYLVRKHASKPDAETAIDRVLGHFQIGNLDVTGWRDARLLPYKDFEDAAVATVAKVSGSAFIITRNVGDFEGSPVPAIAPADFLSQLTAPPQS